MSQNVNVPQNSDPKPKKQRNFKAIGYGVAGVVIGGALTFVFARYNARETSFWKFDPTFWHTDRIELSRDESARPDMQFLELLLPYERNLTAIAQQVIDYKQSDLQVKQLAQAVLNTQERIQIETFKRDDQGKIVKDAQGNPITVKYALKGVGNKVEGLDKLYKNWYSIEADSSRLEVDLVQLQLDEDTNRAFLREMIQNERMAVKLAFLVVDNAQNPEIRALAKDIIEKQGMEMKSLHDALADLKPVSHPLSKSASPSPGVKPMKPSL
ncbi:MAG: DUF305 domain-containing protein [Leptolyngbyaceae cyanobacterium SU_3_3]|nr:DUF305 domain-containing protein [Leptolyngbyaceae cyanobacterium SU_3_3]NJR48361.1 DUF305 domain-containing protein [Leptolyngbyaceae cyanobacterium CSU_1_3]